MAKRIVCAVAALAFLFIQAAMPSAAEGAGREGTDNFAGYTAVEITTAPTCTETGTGVRHLPSGDEEFTVASLGHDWGPCDVVESSSSSVTYTRTCSRCGATETATDDEVEVTNYSCNIRQVLPEAVRKDGIISAGEYDRVYIPEQEIVLANKGPLSDEANRLRAEQIKNSAKFYISYDPVNGLNMAAEYDSPAILQNYDPADYYGYTAPTDSDPEWYYDSDGKWIGPQDSFISQTAFAFDGYDMNDKVIYYVIGRSTETGEYLRGHWYGRSEYGTQYGYDPDYRPSDDEMIISYDGDHVVMEWSIPLEVLIGTSDISGIDGMKYGINFTLTQGTETHEDSYSGTVAIKLGSRGAFENKGARPVRKAKKFTDPVNGKLNEAKINGNLPIVCTFVNDGTYVAAETEPVGPGCTASVSLKDSFDLNIYVNNVTAEMIAAGYGVEYSTDGGATFTPASFDAEHSVGDGKYAFTAASFSANQLTRKAIFRILDGEGGEVRRISYSIKDYCDYQLANSSDANLKALCSALMAYGYYAQLRFPEGASDAIDPEGCVDGIAAVGSFNADLGGFASSAVLAAPVTRATASLALESRTKLNFYLTGVADADGATVTVGGAPWSDFEIIPVSSSKCRVKICGVSTVDLTEQVTLTYGGTVISYSPMAYVKRAIDNETADSEVSRALYLFVKAARDYFFGE